MSRTNWMRILVIGLLVLVLLIAVRLHVAAAQDLRGDPAAGLRLAQAWCAECHAVGSKTTQPRQNAASFTELANLPSTTALSLNAFLRSSHRSMPNLIIAPGDAEHIVAYILSLKRR
jgi:mono/diheme cytochrome c family protein